VYELTFTTQEGMVGKHVVVDLTLAGMMINSGLKRIEVMQEDHFTKSTILASHPKEATALKDFLPRFKTLKLLYRASRDGWQAAVFHRLCDDKGPTVTIVKTSSNGRIFGGYTSASWAASDSGGYKYDPEAFLFSLVNGIQLQRPVKLEMRRGNRCSIYCVAGYGPTFGMGHDLYVSDSANSSGSNSSGLNYSYVAPTGHHFETFLAGAKRFIASEVEVYAVSCEGS